MREDRLAPVQGKRAGDGASSSQMGLGSGGGFPESACCVPQATAGSTIPSPTPSSHVEAKERQVLSPQEKLLTRGPRPRPHPPQTSHAPALSSTVLGICYVPGKDLLPGRSRESGDQVGAGGEMRSQRFWRARWKHSAGRRLSVSLSTPREPGEDTEAQKKGVTCPNHTVT